MKNIILIIAIAICAVSCSKKSEIKITSKVSNCKLESISFGDYKIAGSLITNESSPTEEIRDKKNNFPKTFPIVFYMVSRGNRVFLRTKEEFTLTSEGSL